MYVYLILRNSAFQYEKKAYIFQKLLFVSFNATKIQTLKNLKLSLNVEMVWTPTYGRAKAWRPARTYIQQLCEDTGWSPEDLPEAMNDREKWREREGQGYPC